MRPQIVNIINFIRGVEPRDPCIDLVEPVVNQIRLLKENKLPGTFLLQYDAMIMDQFKDPLISGIEDNIEIGGWFEIVKPLVEKAGIVWRGREGFPWDWYASVGVSSGYSPSEREKLVDVFMEDFRTEFGYYPESIGSWVIDAHTLSYLAERYHIKASCICRDQWGTDGYTFWGGYYNQAYYPSKKNTFSPAQTLGNQIPVPVFRMLGSDPIYQYGAALMGDNSPESGNVEPVITLEPCCVNAGGSPEWVRWYFRENFNGICLSFGYTQVGQENSFGWEAMAKGFTDQIGLIRQMTDAGVLKAEKMKDTGNWYKSQYCLTPSSAIAALSDWKNEGRRSIWYNSRYYRINIFYENEQLYIRDIHFFDEQYEERYLSNVNKEISLIYDNLPVVDGYRWSNGITMAGIYPVKVFEDGHTENVSFGEPVVSDTGEELCVMSRMDEGYMKIICKTDYIEILYYFDLEDINWGMQFQWSTDRHIPITGFDNKSIFFEHMKFKYMLNIDVGRVLKKIEENSILLLPEGERLLLKICALVSME